MKLTTYSTASAFLDAVGVTLGEHEAEHHLVLGVAEGMARGPATPDDLFAASIDDEHGLVLAALMTHHRPLLIASDRQDVSAASALLWDEVWAHARQPRFLIGGVGQAEVAAHEWERRYRREARVTMSQRVYRLTAVDPPPALSGTFRVATLDDLDLVAKWTAEFEAEALAHLVSQSTKASVERRIAAGEIHLWCDPDPRTMAASARPTKHAIAVNGVYTPPAWRRRGYATACVAALSHVLLQRGFAFCVLYTDLSNPTSNSIYTRIGYRPVQDFLMYELPGAGTR